MGVYIKGVEMPKACVYREKGHLITCPLYDIDGYCGALNTEASHKENGKLSNCPLVPVPKHGRLIDADALFDKIPSGDLEHDQMISRTGAIADVCTWVLTAPIIIEAEEKK